MKVTSTLKALALHLSRNLKSSDSSLQNTRFLPSSHPPHRNYLYTSSCDILNHPSPQILPSTIRFSINCLLSNLDTLSQALNNKILTLSTAVNISNIIGSGLEMAGSIVGLGDEDVVVGSALDWLVERNWWTLTIHVSSQFWRLSGKEICGTYHELLLDFTKTLESRCKLKVVVCRGLSNS